MKKNDNTLLDMLTLGVRCSDFTECAVVIDDDDKDDDNVIRREDVSSKVKKGIYGEMGMKEFCGSQQKTDEEIP